MHRLIITYRFFQLNSLRAVEDRNYKGETVYTVTGKEGEIDNTDDAPNQPDLPRVGDRVASLPDGCKTIILNGQKMYVAPDDTYYKAETNGDFTIVGIASKDAQSR